jgi:NAD(P)-dependent dehydrogenase (short-subunit alcohol dehydrogenase family)
VRALVELAVAEHGGIDGLFNNAADISAPHMAQDTDVVTIPNDVWQHTLDVNLTGFLYLTRHAIPALLARGGGSIVQTSSEAAFGGEPVRVAYAVSKAGINALTRHIASRWGKRGIRCNSIAPGMVLTEGAKANMPQAALDEVLAWTRLPRLGSPDDIAGMAAYLLSDDGAWVTGQVMRVNGGVALS